MPSSGISWTAVARLMNGERYPVDYQRKWASYRVSGCGQMSGPGAQGLTPRSAQSQRASGTPSGQASSGATTPLEGEEQVLGTKDHIDRVILTHIIDL